MEIIIEVLRKFLLDLIKDVFLLFLARRLEIWLRECFMSKAV